MPITPGDIIGPIFRHLEFQGLFIVWVLMAMMDFWEVQLKASVQHKAEALRKDRIERAYRELVERQLEERTERELFESENPLGVRERLLLAGRGFFTGDEGQREARERLSASYLDRQRAAEMSALVDEPVAMDEDESPAEFLDMEPSGGWDVSWRNEDGCG